MPLFSIAACLVALAVPAPTVSMVDTVSTGEAFRLEGVLMPEKPTIVLFYQETSSADREVEKSLESSVRDQKGQIGLRLVRLRSLDSPAATTYDIRETPTLMALDRFGNLLKRTSKVDEVVSAAGHATGMARIKWVSEDDPAATKVYRMMGGGKHPVAGILKTMSLRPELMETVGRLAQMAHFSNGYLPRRTKEMIATYVSAINHCKF